jgi:hypothetical protein
MSLVWLGTDSAAAERLNCPRLPAASERVAGVAVTPAGSEPSFTATLPLKLFCGDVAMVRSCGLPPAVRFTDEGATWTEKLC